MEEMEDGDLKNSWKATVTEDLKKTELEWEEAEQKAGHSMEWQNCVAKCAASTWKD
jgi:hypothetical protein